MSINDVIERLDQVTLSISSINARIETLEGKLDSQAERGEIENHEDPTLQNLQSNLSPNNAGHIDINYALVIAVCKHSPRHRKYRLKFGSLLTESVKRLKSTNCQIEVDIFEGGDYVYKQRLLMQLSSHFRY